MSGESAAEKPPPWYSDGLAFECTMCGNCCTGPPGAVWFDDEEGLAMAEAMGIDVRTFYRRYVRSINGRQSLRERHGRHGFDCVLLDRDSGSCRAGCRVYSARPVQCRTWPWWSENLEDRESWERAKRATPCPGMGQGTVVPLEQITINLRKSEAASDRCSDPDW